MPFSAKRAKAGIRCQTLEAKPLDDMSKTVQQLHGVGTHTTTQSVMASSTPEPVCLSTMVFLSAGFTSFCTKSFARSVAIGIPNIARAEAPNDPTLGRVIISVTAFSHSAVLDCRCKVESKGKDTVLQHL